MGQERESSYLTSEETATSFTTVYTYKTRLASNTGTGAVDQVLLFDFLFRGKLKLILN